MCGKKINRRTFVRDTVALGAIAYAGSTTGSQKDVKKRIQESGNSYIKSSRKLPVHQFDVVIAGGGTSGTVAAIAAARQGAKTALIEAKGYTGGTITEGGTCLHSFFNLPKPKAEKRQVVRGIPNEIIERLATVGGTSGHAPMVLNTDYDPVATVVDPELYKLITMRMLAENGVTLCLNTRISDVIMQGSTIRGVFVESHQGGEIIYAKSFVDCTGWGDLAANAGADYTEPNDYPVANSFGMGNVSIEGYRYFLESPGAISQMAVGRRSNEERKIVRLHADEYGDKSALPARFMEQARQIGMSLVVTTIHDNYFLFVKVNYKMKKSPTDRDAASLAELELRNRQLKALELFKDFVPGCEKAFIARTSPHINPRRVRCIKCDYSITGSDVTEGRHFYDDTFVYGFHDSQPRIRVNNGGTYGIPYRAYLPIGIDNLYVVGMMITSEHKAFHSTRNTVSCMGMGQATGTAAALCAKNNKETRELNYTDLRKALEKEDVYFDG